MKKIVLALLVVIVALVSFTDVQADDRDLTTHFAQYTSHEVLFPVKFPYFEGTSEYYSGIDVEFNNGYVIPLKAGTFITPESSSYNPVNGTKLYYNSTDADWVIDTTELQSDPILILYFDDQGLSYKGYYGWIGQSLTMGDPFNPNLDYVAHAEYLLSKPELNLTEAKIRSVFVGIDPADSQVKILDASPGSKARYHMDELAEGAVLDDQELLSVDTITLPPGSYMMDLRDDLIGKDETGIRPLYNTLLTQFLYGVGLLEIDSINVEPTLVPHQFDGLPANGELEYETFMTKQVEFSDNTWIDAINNVSAFKLVDPYDPSQSLSVDVTIAVFKYDDTTQLFPEVADATDTSIFDALTEDNIGELYKVVFASTEGSLTISSTRYYLIQDAFSPVITGLSTADVIVYDDYELNNDIFLDGVTADDGYGVDITADIEVVYPDGFDVNNLVEGTYTVVVSVTNTKMKTTEISLQLIVKDSVAPEASKDDVTITVGSEYDLTQDVTITDNKDTDGFTIIINDDDGFRRSRAGVYEIELYVFDSDGNRTVVSFTVTVEEEQLECPDGQVEEDGVCVDEEPEPEPEPETGCFSTIRYTSPIMLIVAAIGLLSLIIKRRVME